MQNGSWENILAPKLKSKMADDVTSNEQLPRLESEEAEEAMITEPPKNETNTARLMITKIVNENFKSYAGVQELGPFHKVNPWLIVAIEGCKKLEV